MSKISVQSKITKLINVILNYFWARKEKNIPYNMPMTSSNGNIFRVTGPLWGKSNGHRWIPLTKASDVFFYLRLNKRLSKQSRRRWFETPLRPLWRRCNANGDVWSLLLHLDFETHITPSWATYGASLAINLDTNYKTCRHYCVYVI